MSHESDTRIANLVESFEREHRYYVSEVGSTGLPIVIFVFALISFLIIFSAAWLLGTDNVILGAMIPLIFISVLALSAINTYWKALQARKKLNALKLQLDSCGYRICIELDDPDRPSSSGKLRIAGPKDAKESYTILEPHKKIDFSKYNLWF